jgi:hypothetical protein
MNATINTEESATTITKEQPTLNPEKEDDNISASSLESYRISESPARQVLSNPAESTSKSGLSSKILPDTSSTGGEDDDDKDLEEDDEEPSDLGELIAIRKFVRDVSSAASRFSSSSSSTSSSSSACLSRAGSESRRSSAADTVSGYSRSGWSGMASSRSR